MMRHLTANLWLLVLTILLCAVLYPLLLLGIGQAVFPDKANGSLLTDKKGQVVGARLLAQSFGGDEYFQPRPSAVSYNAAATGGTNWGASNPALRQRVLNQLGTILKYGPKGPKPGQPVGPDIEAWFRTNPVKQAELEPAATSKHIQANFYARWREAHPQADLAPVPADMVMASGSGLDPHITLKNARYQLDRVAAAWAAKTTRDQALLRKEIEAILREQTQAPLAGLAGVELVNVLEVNLALRDRYGR